MIGNLRRSIAAVMLASLTALAPIAPVYGQEQTPTPAPAQQQAPPTAETQSPIPLRIPLGPDYSHGKPYFPNVLAPYTAATLEAPKYVNSPRIDQLIQNGELRITLEDAIQLALENNPDISVQEYNAWLAETDILRAKAGSSGRGVAADNTPGLIANLPALSYDPALVTTLSMEDRTIPVNNPLTAGTGTNASGATQETTTRNAIGNFQYTQGFDTGTTIAAGFSTTRTSATSSAVHFDPDVQTVGTVSFTQQLLNGFGFTVNDRFIRVARIAQKATSYAFQQSVLTDVVAVENAYWELVFARGNIAVAQRSVDLAQRLYDDNEAQVRIGTLAPINVVQAEAQVAVANQALIQAQTTELQDQTTLLSVITKNPLAPAVRDVTIIPLDTPQSPPVIENMSLNDAVAEALNRRPDVLQAKLNLTADDLNVKTTKSALLPSMVLSGFVNSTGLSGNSKETVGGVTTIVPSGFDAAAGQTFAGQYPDYEAQIQLTIPIRNRPAQADNERALLTRGQDQDKLLQTYSTVTIDVHNAQITLAQARASYNAAQKTRTLQEQTLAAEQTKLQLGASTIFNVVTDQQSLEAAASAEVRALANLAEAKVNFDRAMGRTLQVNNITIADSKAGPAATGAPGQDTLIPGTLQGQLVGQWPDKH